MVGHLGLQKNNLKKEETLKGFEASVDKRKHDLTSQAVEFQQVWARNVQTQTTWMKVGRKNLANSLNRNRSGGQRSLTLIFIMFFPERRPDRVSGVPAAQLENMIERAQCLRSSRLNELQRWRANDGPNSTALTTTVTTATVWLARAARSGGMG